MSVLAFTQKIVIRGGGDLATGVIQKFFRAGFPVVVLETPAPTAIRRSVALSEAVYDGFAQVEDVSCRKVSGPDELEDCWQAGVVPLLVDPAGESIRLIHPAAVIDAIIAKENLGTNRAMADITIALGPGFCAGKDVQAVIETMRGHDLGKLILQGYAKQDTGMPGNIGGISNRRVLHAPANGIINHKKRIGDVVECGDILLTVDGKPVKVSLSGLVRGLIREGIMVCRGMKVADIDPRIDINWHSISDKARCLGGAVLEAYFYLGSRGNNIHK
ncbi:MAG: EF2563 family selenium-dependent molybdenum hydroxylase system protein [Clostridiales bacterium]|jgi:xanthine dehydrogenase accessory factor|nr:EF2563 family selenium-dependent molybdenum hydroxylase system protein [Clostridiales bacterium]